MLKKLLVMYFGLIYFFQLSNAEAGEIDNNNLRILKLIPDTWLEYPAIDPAIPSDYVMKLTDDDSGFYISWGKQEDLKIIAERKKDRDIDIKAPVLQITFSDSVIQSGLTSFSQEKVSEKEMKDLRKTGIVDVEQYKTKWGNYPVLNFTLKKSNGEKFYFAWVGLNSEAKFVWLINIRSPQNKEKETEKLWNDFINKTRQLPEPEYFIAKGMDMREGYTIYKRGTASLNVFAEKTPDGRIAIKVNPLKQNVSFKINNVDKAFMGSRWKFAYPCIKVHGRLNEKDGNMENIIDSIITVLPKNVNEFSFDLNQKNHAKNVVIYSDQLQQSNYK